MWSRKEVIDWRQSEIEKARLIHRRSVFMRVKRSYKDVYICCELSVNVLLWK